MGGVRHAGDFEHDPAPVRIYAKEGLCQKLFFQSDEKCEISYAARKGKYQNQQGIVLSKL